MQNLENSLENKRERVHFQSSCRSSVRNFTKQQTFVAGFFLGIFQNLRKSYSEHSNTFKQLLLHEKISDAYLQPDRISIIELFYEKKPRYLTGFKYTSQFFITISQGPDCCFDHFINCFNSILGRKNRSKKSSNFKVQSCKSWIGQTNLIFRFAAPPAWYFFQIEIKISHTKKPP